jgi:thymidylate synthase (FAD)
VIRMSAENRPKIDLPISETRRPVSPGAEQWLGEVIPVLDHGFIYLVDYMGNDVSIEEAARVSYGRGTRKVNETRGLIRYLKRHEHTTPFEMVEFKFHAKLPIFVARQWVRHRTASINEYSGRYSVLDSEFYIPKPGDMGLQSKSNRQGRDGVIDRVQADHIRQLLFEDAVRNYRDYEFMLNDDGKGGPSDSSRDMLARELARMNLNLNFYTEWYWKINLHNLFRFIQLRADPHAQYEIAEYARGISQILKDAVPVAWEAFTDYQLESIRLTRPEKEVLLGLMKGREGISEDEVMKISARIGLVNKRETQEMLSKFKSMGLISK